MGEGALIQSFLEGKRLAMVGVSRNKADFSRIVMRDFVKRGYDVVPVNPAAEEIGGRRAFATVGEVDPPVDRALVMVPAEKAEGVVRDCREAGIQAVWLFRAVGRGAVSDAAVDLCRAGDMDVIPGRCPLMFLPNAGPIHRFHAFLLKLVGKHPEQADAGDSG